MLPILVVILIAVNVVVLSSNADTTKRLEVQQSATIKARDELQSKSKSLERMEKEKVDIESSLREERLKSEGIQQENQSLKVSLQAKKEREAESVRLAQARVNEAPKPVQSAPRPAISGNKEAWLAASGIPQSEWWAVDFIVSRESGWDPCAYNPSKSDCSANPATACGLAQSLPCGKQSVYGHWTDPVANLKWQYDYVRGRYGSYAGAVAFWQANHHY